MLRAIQGKVIHIFREENIIADALASEVIEHQLEKEYNMFTDLLTKVRKLFNMDKSQIPNLRIRTCKTIKQ